MTDLIEQYPDELKTLEIEIDCFDIGLNKIVGIENIIKFFQEGYSCLNNLADEIKNNPNSGGLLGSITLAYKNFSENIKNIINNSSRFNKISERLDNIENNIYASIRDRFPNSKFLLSSTPTVLFLEALYKQKFSYGEGALLYYFRNIFLASSYGKLNTAYFNNYDLILGFLKAFDFEQKKDPNNLSRLKAEEESFDSLRKTWVDNTGILNNEFNQIVTGYNDWKNNIESSVDVWQKNKNEEIEQIITIETNKLKAVTDKATSDFEALKKAYEEKLRLEAPVTYWSERAKAYKKKGNWALVFLIVAITVTVGASLAILYNEPEVLKISNFWTDPNALRGLVLLTLAI